MTDACDLTQARYTAAGRSCDVVMKGGITSGVVYPHAVCELAQTYRFRNVGGTSAGAIAAAATAAAEYGRARRGFNKLAGLPAWLGKGSNLRDLFQAQPSTRKPFAVMLAKLEGGARRAARAAVRHYPLATFLGALPALALAGVGLWAAIAEGSTLLIVLAVIVAAAVGLPLLLFGMVLAVAARLLFEANRRIPDNGFGICSGMAGNGSRTPALTEWLSERLNAYAGLPKEKPLTFGHLWAGPNRKRSEGLEEPGERWLNLAMMSTNLVNRRAHQLPWASREWFFDPEEFRKLFPQAVVRWMEEHPPPPPEGYTANEIRESRMRQALMRPRLPLPAAADLPVVVATRMSLSFPVLLSAVPLWNLDMTREENRCLDAWKKWACEQDEGWDPLEGDEDDWPSAGRPQGRPVAECCWFSDGGISSNFPVHFFDRLIPRWPTFAINLRPFPLAHEPDQADEASNTWMVESNGDGIAEWWHRFPGPGGRWDGRLGAFLSSVVRTMQNRVDEAQMRVPGYRDRVSHVSMAEDEGGMNLTMPPERIEALGRRGRFAAQRLRDAYTPPDGEGKSITWDNHRWVRLRSTLSVLEEMHDRFVAGYGGEPENGEPTYAQLAERGKDDPPKSYPWKNQNQKDLALKEIEAIELAAQRGGLDGAVAEDAPNPAPVGRIVPKE